VKGQGGKGVPRTRGAGDDTKSRYM